MPDPSSRPPRRGEDPRPYPGAPSRTRPHRARPGTTRSTRSRSGRVTDAASLPCSVWAPATAVDPGLMWPPVVIRQITTAFSDHGARVGLLPWPTANPDTPGGTASALDEQADTVLALIDKLGRSGVLEHLPAPFSNAATAGVPPFWDPLINPDAHRAEPVLGQLVEPPQASTTGSVADLDLIITSLAPDDSGDAVSDLVALHASRRLRSGGVFTVLTHSEHRGEELVDPTGAVVAAGQSADLLYLQHVVVLHTPLHRRPFTPTEHPASGPGRGCRHQRTHSDLLVFAQPADPTPLDPGQEASQ